MQEISLKLSCLMERQEADKEALQQRLSALEQAVREIAADQETLKKAIAPDSQGKGCASLTVDGSGAKAWRGMEDAEEEHREEEVLLRASKRRGPEPSEEEPQSKVPHMNPRSCASGHGHVEQRINSTPMLVSFRYLACLVLHLQPQDASSIHSLSVNSLRYSPQKAVARLASLLVQKDPSNKRQLKNAVSKTWSKIFEGLKVFLRLWWAQLVREDFSPAAVTRPTLTKSWT